MSEMTAFSHQSSIARRAALIDYGIREPEVSDYDTLDFTILEIEGYLT
jgi:hypothetical protein